MSDYIEIESSLGSYVVEFHQFPDVYSLEEIDACFYLIDSLVADLHHSSMPPNSKVYRLEALEQNKTLSSVTEILELFKEQSNTNEYHDIIKVCDEMLVSSDFIGEGANAVIDSTSVMKSGDMYKFLVWYDNEMGYAKNIIRFIKYLKF